MFQDFELSIKAASDTGQFEGLAAVYGNRDHGGDIILPGAFARTLREKGAERPLLWNHDQGTPVGLGALTDSAAGLHVKAELDLDTQAGRETYSRLRKKIIRGLSIGFIPAPGGSSERGGTRYLSDVDLHEVSLCAIPMNDRARVTAVKSTADLVTVRDFEDFLRQSGFSRAKATALASKGWRGAFEEAEDDPAALLEWLRAQRA